MDASIVPSSTGLEHLDGPARDPGARPRSVIGGLRGRDIAIAAVLTAAFVALQIRASLYAGALSLPPTYDDITYYVDAARRVRMFWHGDFAAVVSDSIVSPPHAPGATLLAAIGFLLLGIRPWAADVANALPLFAFVLVLMWLFSGLPVLIVLPAVLALLTIPIFAVAVTEFRPDMWCACLTVFGTLVIVLRDPRETKTAVAAGLALAAALLMKPTFAPLAVVLFAGASVLRLAPHWQDPAQRPSCLRACLIIGLLGLAIAGPYYIVALRSLIDYYQANVFGSGAQFWIPALTKTENAVYYVTGPGGKLALGPWMYLGPLTLAVPFILFARRRYALAWQAGIVAILALIAYATITLAKNKSVFLGIIFPCYVAGAIIVSVPLGLRALVFRKMTAVAYIASGVLLFLAVATFRLPWLRVHGDVVFPAEITASRHKAVQEVASLLEADPAISQKTVMFAQIGSYLNADVLGFYFMQRDLPVPKFIGNAFSDDLAVQRAFVTRAQYVVTMTRDYPDTIAWLPSTGLVEAFDALVGPEAGFELEKTINPGREPGAIRVYKRIRN